VAFEGMTVATSCNIVDIANNVPPLSTKHA